MPKSKSKPSGFQPIEVEVGEQNRPIVSEVNFTTPAPQEPAKAHTAPPKPQTAADTKKEH